MAAPAPPSQQELRKAIQEIQALDLSPEDKAKRVQELMMRGRAAPEPSEEIDEDACVCRYCLTETGLEDEPSELIQPCKCIGGQQWCHMSCLRTWQRKVLVMQSPNPRFHTDDTRHEACNVCKETFKVPPPSRRDLMVGLTGQDLVDLCEVGCLIVSSKDHSQRIGMALQVFQGREVQQMANWYHGVYLIITANSEGDGSIHALNLNREIPVEKLPKFPLWKHVQEINGEFASATMNVHHYLGGPCMPQMPVAVAVLHFPEGSAPERGGFMPILTEGERMVIAGGVDRVGELAKEHGSNALLVYWGLAGWTKTQLLGELARGSWGMCKGGVDDVKSWPGTPAGELWGLLHEQREESGRMLVYAPMNEMQAPDWGQEEALETH